MRRRNSQLQTLGNLTLLNKHLNPAASNSSFDSKRAEYKHSVLRLNRYFDGLDGLDGWDEASIANRGRQLAEMMCRMWPRPEQTA